jgi:hypothetical protein
MEEKKRDERMSLLGKRHGPESDKQVTTLGTKDISSFFPSKRPTTTSSVASISCASKLHTMNDVSAGNQPCEEIQGTAVVGLSSSELDKLNN